MDGSQSEFHRDHESVLLDFEMVERRDGEAGRSSPTYALAASERAEYAVELHYPLQSELERSGAPSEGNVESFEE